MIYEAKGIRLVLSLLFDSISVLFFRTVIMISGGVFIFRSSYMEGDKFAPRFRLLVLSFVGRIVLLIFTSNIVTILLGWDGLGVTSYLLVCYYCSEKRFNARMLTALTNRIGDVAILILISQLAATRVFNFRLISSSNRRALRIRFILVVVAAITKRAQLPFSSWLPAAIAAPTPVSALVHSSTLVTAGVYLLIRHNYILWTRGWANLIVWLGLITIIMAGSAALFELDIKKVIALSTLRQLGVIFFSLGLGLPYLAFFHLVAHAYFKAILFIAAGAIIHRVKDYQDLRKMGSFTYRIPRLAGVVLISNLSLCGLPFMAGFYSKDSILETVIIRRSRFLVWRGAMLGTLLTVAYSCRFTLGVLGRFSRREPFSGEADGRKNMIKGMLILWMPSILGGWFLSGTTSESPLVFLRIGIKIFILIIIVRVRSILLVIGQFRSRPTSSGARALHQIWFIPLFLRPSLTKQRLPLAANRVKMRDSRWVTFISWKWITSILSGIGYRMSNLQLLTISRILMMLLLRVFQ